ncbi:bifunctional catalase-peroxidase cat2 [Grosmannia clavigera kw1407]|uniref:Catalase-peroxidase n=1 Tax=Grosmannia clavigera (strain kw1407 / UAMH 11150) TaxID=655863 RepID=F0XL63_GROCL|nr:bifunctional catalase-peroxidase cat2 [Grosmannia clavigera kw1407]EFX01688.1 bifunctional catalase-peroxidase cat2 [Grosmannia clavigera kw1407]
MFDTVSPSRLLALTVCSLPLVSAAACPFGHSKRDAVPDFHKPMLQERYSADGADFGVCPRKANVAGGGTRSKDWWPCALSLAVLRQNADQSNPLGGDFDYATEFAKLDVEALRKDITELQTNSQEWWPADFGNYGGFFIRMAWHSAGTYRQIDGRGGSGMGQQRFAQLNSWADNASLDKARRLLWPIKQKYGNMISWADLMEFTGHVAIENMGLPLYGFGFGRVDTWQADEGIYWGSEHEMYSQPGSYKDRYNGSTDITDRADKLEKPLSATNMGLIYVDPQGPSGNPEPAGSALDIRETFGRMGMDDEETVSLIAGGHTFGKTHGAVSGDYIGPEPMAAPIELQGLGWKNSFESGVGENAYTSGIEVIWSKTPTNWSNHFFDSLFGNNWTLASSPAGAHQWEAVNGNVSIPDPFVAGKFRKPTMLTSDLALLNDVSYLNISNTFWNDPKYFGETFARTWFKLLHRDMGPISRYLGPYVPKTQLIWQDPLPTVSSQTIDDADVTQLKAAILSSCNLSSGLNTSSLITTAWGAASSFRISDKRGGANGGRIALEPQNSFAVNNPDRLKIVLPALEKVMTDFNSKNTGKKVSLADLIVLGGTAAVEKAAKDAGLTVSVPFTPGRVDTTQELTDVKSFAFLEPVADGFRNYGQGNARALTEELLVDKASLLSLTVPEMTVLVGGMRSLDANYDGSSYGIFTDRPGKLSNDFFVNLLNISTTWTAVNGTNDEIFTGTDLYTGASKYTATRADLIFGSHPELRAVAEVYGSSTAQQKFADDFVKAWAKVMDLDRYDVKGRKQNNVQ